MLPHRLVKRNYGGKLPVSIKYQNLYSFKEGMIHLCQSILETRLISHLLGSVSLTNHLADQKSFLQVIFNAFSGIFESASIVLSSSVIMESRNIK